jgi:hypothetical protein
MDAVGHINKDVEGYNKQLGDTTNDQYIPEPILEEKEYMYILEVLKSMSIVIERNPDAFADSDEEAIRTHQTFGMYINKCFENTRAIYSIYSMMSDYGTYRNEENVNKVIAVKLPTEANSLFMLRITDIIIYWVYTINLTDKK